jgi:hypothetical protein
MAIRAALLAIVDAIEEYLGMERTKEIRRSYKDARRDYENWALSAEKDVYD